MACQYPVGSGLQSCTRYVGVEEYDCCESLNRVILCNISLHIAPNGAPLSAYVLQSLKESKNVEQL